MRKFLIILTGALLVASCGIYSFTGTSIQADVKTITICRRSSANSPAWSR